jgi:alanyl aminopeptidase
MEWWDDLWLNEAFADWIGHKVTYRLYPELGGEVSELQRAQRFFAADARPSTKPIRRRVEPGEQLMEGVGLTYLKGKIVLSAFEHWVGEESFRRGVNDYIAAHEWGNAEAADLWRALDSASGRDVSGAMAAFLEQPGHPRIDFEIEGARVTLRQSRFRNAGVETEDLLWKVPVVLRYSDGRTVRTRRVLLEGETKAVELEADGEIEWLVPNSGAGGCFRWSLLPEHLAALAAVADRELAPIERVELLGNLGALLDAGAVGAVDYVEVLQRFADDPEPAVVTAVLAGLGTVRRTFVTDDLEDEFAGFVLATLGPTLDRIGIEARSGEDELTSSLRSSLLNWLGDYGRDPRVRAHARTVADAYVADPASVDPSVAGISLSLAALDGDVELFDSYQQRFETAEVPAEKARFLAALGAFRDPVLAERALAYALDGPLRPQEVGVIPWGLRDTEWGRQRTFDWLTEHWDELAARVSPPSLARSPAFGGDCSAERLAAMLAFFEEPSRRVPGAERSIRSTESRVTDCLRMRAVEGPAVAGWLQAFATNAGSSGPATTPRSSPRRP